MKKLKHVLINVLHVEILILNSNPNIKKLLEWVGYQNGFQKSKNQALKKVVKTLV